MGQPVCVESELRLPFRPQWADLLASILPPTSRAIAGITTGLAGHEVNEEHFDYVPIYQTAQRGVLLDRRPEGSHGLYRLDHE